MTITVCSPVTSVFLHVGQLMEVLRTIKTEVYRRVINDEIADGESFVKLYDHTIRENLSTYNTVKPVFRGHLNILESVIGDLLS